jgi:hypothetical protein
LALEIKQLWQLNKIIVIPLVLSATRIITNMLQPKPHCPQFTAMPIVPGPEGRHTNTYCIVGEFLNDDAHISDEEADNNKHITLQCSQLSTLISMYPDATSEQVLGSKGAC